VQNALQQIGGAVGLAVLSTIAVRHTVHLARGGTNPIVATVDGYRLGFLIGALVVVAGAVLVAVLMERAYPADAAPDDEPVPAVAAVV
jgi:hypothetical protein